MPGGGLSAGTGAAFNVLAPMNQAGVAFTQGWETIDAITAQLAQSTFAINWGEASLGAGLTGYYFASQTYELNAVQMAYAPSNGYFTNTTITTVQNAVTNPIVFTLWTGGATGSLTASAAQVCTIPVGSNICSVAIPQSIAAGGRYVWGIANNSTGNTGNISISTQFVRTR
jgi:hypothetical protein